MKRLFISLLIACTLMGSFQSARAIFSETKEKIVLGSLVLGSGLLFSAAQAPIIATPLAVAALASCCLATDVGFELNILQKLRSRYNKRFNNNNQNQSQQNAKKHNRGNNKNNTKTRTNEAFQVLQTLVKEARTENTKNPNQVGKPCALCRRKCQHDSNKYYQCSQAHNESICEPCHLRYNTIFFKKPACPICEADLKTNLNNNNLKTNTTYKTGKRTNKKNTPNISQQPPVQPQGNSGKIGSWQFFNAIVQQQKKCALCKKAVTTTDRTFCQCDIHTESIYCIPCSSEHWQQTGCRGAMLSINPSVWPGNKK